jgi:hypothetical protein
LAVDLHAFGDLRARADLAEDGRQRLALLDEALGLWRGEPFASLNTPWFDEVRTRLDAQRLAAVLDRNDAALACGRHASMLGELSGLAVANPADERVAGQLMVALYLCGRQDEAIRRYHCIRGYLVEEFGVDPGPGLQELYRRLLAADPSLGPGLGTVPSPEPTKHSQYGLPADVAVLAGRDKEIQTILDGADNVDSADGRMTVLSIHAIDGMPGVGKSALAVHVAHRLAGRFPDGPVFIDLHGHSARRGPAEPAEVLAALLTADGVDPNRLPGDLDGRSTLWRERLAGRRVLLVLDNAASTAQVQPLLPAAPGCMAIVTSRRFLGDLPAAVTTLPLDALSADDAARMFLRLVPRAGSEPVAVADVVAACGHLPLAISLVARLLERHRAWSVADLLAETRSRLVHLATEDLTVAAAFDLSYRHLPPPLQRMLSLLGLHPGTEFEPHAAAALAGTGVEQASAWLQALHADNLLTEIGYHRYAMHDLLHQYARDLAATEPASERHAAQARLFDYYQAATAISQSALACGRPQ